MSTLVEIARWAFRTSNIPVALLKMIPKEMTGSFTVRGKDARVRVRAVRDKNRSG